MKKIIVLILFCFSTHSSYADENRRGLFGSEPDSSSSELKNLQWMAGIGLGTAGSLFHFGALIRGLYPIASIEKGDFLAGIETGFLLGPGTPSTWLIPIMASTQFNFKSGYDFTPYVGIDMGVGIYHESTGTVTTSSGLQLTGNATTRAHIALLAKGGVFLGKTQKYFAELPMGTLGNAFAIFPTVGMKF